MKKIIILASLLMGFTFPAMATTLQRGGRVALVGMRS